MRETESVRKQERTIAYCCKRAREAERERERKIAKTRERIVRVCL